MREVQEGGLWCHQVLAGLDRYVDGELPPDELSAVVAHVSVCDRCASFGEGYARVVATLRAKAPPDAPPLDRLRARLDRELD